MAFPLGVILGVITMLCWGAADFFAAKAVRKDVYKTLLWSQVVEILGFLSVLYLFFGIPLLSTATIGIILVMGFLSVASYMAYYKGLQIGIVSVVSPITACWGAVTFILSLFFLGESVTAFQASGVILAISGAVLVSFKWHDLRRAKNIAKGAKLGAIAALGWGIYFVFIGALVSELNWLVIILFSKFVGVLYLMAYYGASRKSFSFPKIIAPFVVLVGVLEVIGYLAYGSGIIYEYTAIVAPVAAAFPVVTIILARMFFREELEPNQKMGIVSVLAGLVLLSM